MIANLLKRGQNKQQQQKVKKNADFSYTIQNMRKVSLETTFSSNRLCFSPYSN